MEEQYTINQIELLSGIKSHTLRMWEKRYSIITPKRKESNFRYFDGDDLKKILNISFLNANGFKISKIAKLTDQELAVQVKKVYDEFKGNSDVDILLVQALLSYDIDAFNEIFETFKEKKSFDKAIVDLVIPFFERIGVLWQINSICPAQEHLFSQFIKQKIMYEIGTVPVESKDSKRALLYLRDGEYHDLGLMLMHYSLAKLGIKVYNLGASVPSENLKSAVDHIKPSYIVSSFISYIDNETFSSYFNEIKKHTNKDVKYIFTGNWKLLEECNVNDDYVVLKNTIDIQKHLD